MTIELDVINAPTNNISSTIKLNGNITPHKNQIGDILLTTKGKIKITKQIRMKDNRGKNEKAYEYICLLCGYEGKSFEPSIVKGVGCPVCVNRKVKIGFNDIWTTNPYLAKLLANPEDGYKYVQHSHKRVDWKCLDCGEVISNLMIKQINLQGLSCPKCSDGVSYPEKIMFNLLSQLNIDFKKGKVFKWSEKRKYDFYLNKYNIIIETHGEQHYKNSFTMLYGDSLLDTQANDIFKQELAKNNNIDKYIIIDARKSELGYIKNNILDSELSQLFDLSEINWNKCHEYACCSLAKIVCDLWNSTTTDIAQIIEITNFSKSVIIKYLRQGTILGWCNYKPKGTNKAVVKLDKDTYELMDTYESMNEAGRQMKYVANNIWRCCNNIERLCGGFRWMKVSDYNLFLEQQSK